MITNGGYDFKGLLDVSKLRHACSWEKFFTVQVGQDIKTFADTYLFSKLNITSDSAQWWRDNSTGGQANGNYLILLLLDMTARDFAKDCFTFGQ